MSSVRGNCICVQECQEICVCPQWIVNPISYAEYLSSISWYSTCRELQYPRHGCYDLNTSVILPSLSDRYVLLRWPVIRYVEFLRDFCNYAYDLCKSSSMMLFNALLLISTLRLNHYNDKNFIHFSFHRVTTFMIFRQYFLSQYRRIIISHEE